MSLQYDMFESPLGPLTVCTDGVNITGLHIEGDRYFAGIPVDWSRNPDSPVLRRAKLQLGEYFVGRRRVFTLPLAPAGTPFQQQVWRALEEIPPGSTTTYGDIAQTIGRPKAVRAVGTAIGRNPICIFVPCHRVLAAGGGLGGYVAGIGCKQTLLNLESVHG